MDSKRGQFFILAAVLIASLVFSLSIAKNVLIGSEKPEDFYLIGEQFDRELKAVLDYDLITGEDKVSDFINDSMDYFRRTKPYTEVVFMYYQNGNFTIENYANSSINVSGFVPCMVGCEISVGGKYGKPVVSSRLINLAINGQNFEYNLSKGSKSYIVLMRTVNREIYFDVKE